MATPFLTWGYDIVKFSDFSSALSSVGTILNCPSTFNCIPLSLSRSLDTGVN
jgi:hypothetical protein